MTARFLALGDSYTIGEGVAERERWPVQLVELLRDEGFEVLDAEIVAKTGWTTDELAAGIGAAGVVGAFSLVSLAVGVNNQYRGWPLAEYKAEFASLLERAVAFGGGEPGRVMVLSIPDWGVTPFAEGRDGAAIAEQIDAFNTVNREVAARAGVAYVDVTGISRAAGGGAERVTHDGLHPSGEMYRRWAQAALPAARRALGEV